LAIKAGRKLKLQLNRCTVLIYTDRIVEV